MGLRLSLLLHAGRALAIDEIAAAFAAVVRGKLGTSTLAIRYATRASLHAIATYESTDRYVLHVPQSEIDRERAALTEASSLRGVVLGAARSAARGSVRDRQPGAPTQELPEEWLALVAAELSRVTPRTLWVTLGDRYSPAVHSVYERGERIAGTFEDADCVAANAAAAQLAGVRAIDVREAFADLERPAPLLHVIARAGRLLAASEPTSDASHLELVE